MSNSLARNPIFCAMRKFPPTPTHMDYLFLAESDGKLLSYSHFNSLKKRKKRPKKRNSSFGAIRRLLLLSQCLRERDNKNSCNGFINTRDIDITNFGLLSPKPPLWCYKKSPSTFQMTLYSHGYEITKFHANNFLKKRDLDIYNCF